MLSCSVREMHHAPLAMCQKRPTTVSKETYYCVKRDLLMHHSPLAMLLRGLHIYQYIPPYISRCTYLHVVSRYITLNPKPKT